MGYIPVTGFLTTILSTSIPPGYTVVCYEIFPDCAGKHHVTVGL